MSKKLSPTEMLNAVRSKANLGEQTDYSKSAAIRLKAGKIKFQLIAADCEHLFKSRVQHVIPPVPGEDNPNEKWLVADCVRENCPICKAANVFKKSNVTTLEEINNTFNMKYPYRSISALFTQPEHYLLLAKVLSDQADDGSYLPKESEIGSTHLIQFPRTALNNLMSAYEDYLEDHEDEENEDLFAIFDDGKIKAKSLQVTCRVTNQPYSCTFAFGKLLEIDKADVDSDKLDILASEEVKVSDEHYNKLIKRIKDMQNYFSGNAIKEEIEEITEDIPFGLKEEKKDDFSIEDML